MDDYYKLLGVPPTASTAEIRRTYRRLANEFHPDRLQAERATVSDDPELLADLERRIEAATHKMQRINAAYDVLKDPVSRSRYDRLLSLHRMGRRPPRPRQTRRATNQTTTRPPPHRTTGQAQRQRQPQAKPPPRKANVGGIVRVIGFIIIIQLFVNVGIHIFESNSSSGESPYTVLLTQPAPIPPTPFTDPNPAEDETQASQLLAQQNYWLGMESLQALVNGGKLGVEGNRALRYFAVAMNEDPTMAAAYRNYGLLMAEVWHRTDDYRYWMEASRALTMYRELGDWEDPVVANVQAKLEDDRNQAVGDSPRSGNCSWEIDRLGMEGDC